MDDPLKTALATFAAQGGVLSAPASDSDIAAANTELAAHDCPELPPDYVAFLKHANGLMREGFLLYPVRGEQVSLVSATIKERKDNFHERCHVCGFRSLRVDARRPRLGDRRVSLARRERPADGNLHLIGNAAR